MTAYNHDLLLLLRSADPVQKACALCGRQFIPPHPSVKYCSDACRSEGYHAKRMAAAVRGFHRRRARLRGAEAAPYDRLAIFERDGWTCKLCGLPLPRSGAQWPDPDFPTIDHIVPIAKGGSDTPDNVQAAHLRCNLRKGDRVA